MYPRRRVNEETPLCSHFTKGEVEIINYDYTKHRGLEGWSDSDFVRDVLAGWSLISTEHTYNSVSCPWTCTKQPSLGGSVDEADTRSLFQATRKKNRITL